MRSICLLAMQLLKWLLTIGILSTVTITFISLNELQFRDQHSLKTEELKYETPLDFQGFDNVSGTINGCYIVPNIVHFVRFDQPEFSFVDTICVLAAFKNQKPERILFHTNLSNFTGKYWRILLSVPGLTEKVFLKHMDVPKSIFGQPFSRRFRNFHAGDVARLKVLMDHGGIFLDNDSYIVKSLNDFRRFEMTLGWREGGNISNQVIIAHKNARFLREWLGTYNNHYEPKLWFYNAGIRPTQAVLLRHPELVHRVKKRLAEFGGTGRMIYTTRSNAWKEHYAIHLLVNHQFELLKRKPIRYDDRNIKNYNISLKDMAYDVYPFNDGTRRDVGE